MKYLLSYKTLVLAIVTFSSAVVVVKGQETTLPPLLPPDALIEVPGLGKIQGLKWFSSTTLTPFYVFHSIKYAHDTSGANRFKPSKLFEGPLMENGETFNATNPLVVCPQGIFDKFPEIDATSATMYNLFRKGLWKWSEKRVNHKRSVDLESEDCLVLNVNTPSIPKAGEPNPKYPVIFFIHGGSSTQVWGAPFTGLRFLEHEVILVTINYRLGVLGALNLGIDDAPGNAAMYDALAALDWVHKYIHHFGGDKDRITVYGHSAGSMMATHLMLSPLAAGKFSGVIGASGSALAPWGTAKENSISEHLKVAYHAKCYDNENGVPPQTDAEYQTIYECMSKATKEELMDALSTYSGIEEKAGGLGFDAKSPSVQNSPRLTSATPRFLTEMPVEILRKGTQNPVNLIMGATRHDGTFAFDDIYEHYIKDKVDDQVFMRNELLIQLIETLKGTDRTGAFPHIIAKTYFGDGIKSGSFKEMLPGLIDLTSVWGFKAPGYELLQKHAAVNPNSFFYSFDFLGFWSTCDMLGESEIPCGVPHIDDMSMTFQIFPIVSRDLEVSRRMVQYFVNFATYGTPNNPNEPDQLLFWPGYDSMTHPFLKIDYEDSIGENCRDSWIGNALEIVEPLQH